jgi:hypothetical protein
MRSPTHARLALALTLALVVSPVARGQDDADAPAADPDSPRGSGFGWVCVVTAVAAVGGLYVLVRRRQQAAEEEWRRGRGPATPWYCRACAKDVSGPACPHCQAPNPFHHGPLDADVDTAAARITSRPRRKRPARDVGRARDADGAADPGD